MVHIITITVLEDFLSPIIVQEHSLFEWIISSTKISREMVARSAMNFTIWKQICFVYGIALDSRLTSKLQMDIYFKGKKIKLTTMSFPAFSGLFAISMAAAAAAPDDIPT
jgi:hypothetical protein